ncbi:unnamed protein product [Acanthoscelides obtectus]|uniref:Uncharacterized protein n=1 Tax=Acanthoscelides obtectus TaxID=200917 RepID=A0A9P0NW95_ACAOB|nr:unnamed protein product [Acanthoscelides obtectus]CAK1662055.1 hypothetical protein AOBTE_LOCUS22949 [Acanthoscelides obtectus]
MNHRNYNFYIWKFACVANKTDKSSCVSGNFNMRNFDNTHQFPQSSYSTCSIILDVLNTKISTSLDGATCQTATETMDLLRDKFGVSVISRNEPHNWPPRSCDLTPLDLFFVRVC